jgi:hypothetical protein
MVFILKQARHLLGEPAFFLFVNPTFVLFCVAILHLFVIALKNENLIFSSFLMSQRHQAAKPLI